MDKIFYVVTFQKCIDNTIDKRMIHLKDCTWLNG